MGYIGADPALNESVTSAQIADNAIITAKINADAVTNAKIADGQVDTEHLAGDAVTGDKIEDDAIESEHYANTSIDAGHLASGVGSEGWIHITDVNVTSAASYITIPNDGGHFDGSYRVFKIIGQNINSDTNDTHLYMQVSTNGGAWDDSYLSKVMHESSHDGSGSSNHSGNTGQSDLFLFNGMGNTADIVVSFEINIYNAASTTYAKHFRIWVGGDRQNAHNSYVVQGTGTWSDSGNELQGFRLLPNANNIKGKLSLYGLKD